MVVEGVVARVHSKVELLSSLSKSAGYPVAERVPGGEAVWSFVRSVGGIGHEDCDVLADFVHDVTSWGGWSCDVGSENNHKQIHQR